MRPGIKISHPFKILSDDDLYKIHVSSLEVLERSGISVDHEDALKKLEERGAEVDYKKSVVKIPEYLIKEALEKTPRNVILCGRNPKNDVSLEKGRSYATTTGGAVYVIGQDGSYRRATIADVGNLTRLADGLENIDFNEGLVDPQEIPPKIRDIYSILSIFKNTEKHIRYVVASYEGLEAFIKIASILVGGENELRKRPIVSGICVLSPPFKYDKKNIDFMIEFSKRGIPVYVGAEQLLGGIAPVTLAGTLVQNNAGCLAGIFIAQTLAPGNPVIYGGNLHNLDMLTGVAVQASPENALMHVGLVQLSHYYNLPSWLYSDMTNSKVPDEQIGYEKMMTSILPLLTGPSIHFAAGNMSTAIATSYEQLIIDDEILSMLRRIAEGIEVNDETLAVDVICKVGPTGHYLAEKHTSQNFRQENWLPKLSDRKSIGVWKKEGGRNIFQRAKEKADEILKNHYPDRLPKDVENEIDEVVKQIISQLS